MLPREIDSVDYGDEEELELYSWFNDEQYHSRLEYDSNSIEDEEEEDEEMHDYPSERRNQHDKLHYSQDLDIST